MQNKKAILTLIFCLVLVGIGTFINKLVFNTGEKEVDKGKRYNELVSRGYTLVDLNKKTDFINGYKVYTKNDKDYLDNNDKICIIAKDNNTYFKYLDNEYQINILNIIDYYMYINDNTIYVYLLDKDNKLYYSHYEFSVSEDIINIIDKVNNLFKEIKSDKEIISFKRIVTIHKLLDNRNYEYLVGVSKDSKEYIIENGDVLREINNKEYFNISYYYNDETYILTNNRELIISNVDSLFNVKYILGEYFVSNDNYLYKVSNKNITCEYDNKIKYIFYYKYDNIFKLAFIFDNDDSKQIDLIIKDYDYEIQGISIESKK